MRISGFTTVRPNMPSTRTFEDFSKFLGANPARLGIVSTLYDQFTASHLTEALMNTYAMEKKSKGFQSVNSFLIEWDIEVNKIKRVPMVLAPEGTGLNAGDVKFYFGENYYQKYDTFIVENTRQQFFVINRPQRVRDNCWLVIAKIMDNDYDSTVDSRTVAGSQTRFVTNWHPELHTEGYTKYQSSCEKHRTYIGTHRCDIDMSAMYNPMEETFIQIGKGEKDDPVYKLTKAEKVVLDNFMEARANALVWGKSDMDPVTGKPKIYDEDGRPIITGDGLINQIERFATKFVFSKLNMGFFERALQVMAARSEKPQGNTYTMIVNTPFYQEWQRVANAWIAAHHTDGAFLYSKATNGYIELGATYESYTFGGNKLIIKIDKCFDVEYPTRKYGIILDLTPDGNTGRPALAQFTFKGGDYIQNEILGVGGATGLASGVVASPVAGKKLIRWGYSGMAVFNPYRSVIMIGEETRDSFWA